MLPSKRCPRLTLKSQKSVRWPSSGVCREPASCDCDQPITTSSCRTKVMCYVRCGNLLGSYVDHPLQSALQAIGTDAPTVGVTAQLDAAPGPLSAARRPI